MSDFKYKLRDTVDIVGGLTGVVIVQRGTWESLSVPEPRNFYVVRSDDKEITVNEEEIY